MSVETATVETETKQEVMVSQAIQSLGATLKATPELQAFLQAAQAIHADMTIQHLLQQIRSHRAALQWDQGNPAEHLQALKELQADLDGQPAVQVYYRAERAARRLLQAVDVAISEAAGVDFAANAKRSCCG
jgi:cell fate (sporulation/competence/biofilm development) regulator YlbF (YheA/YmcA/DUF963 family)